MSIDAKISKLNLAQLKKLSKEYNELVSIKVTGMTRKDLIEELQVRRGEVMINGKSFDEILNIPDREVRGAVGAAKKAKKEAKSKKPPVKKAPPQKDIPKSTGKAPSKLSGKDLASAKLTEELRSAQTKVRLLNQQLKKGGLSLSQQKVRVSLFKKLQDEVKRKLGALKALQDQK
jgi:hypothetical protein|tara:strand:- start:2039 stop:2563 length:525 start_codon:yes stop_codon:yes gene_type:complete